jgi:DNA-binding NtrC family response regulator
MSSVWLVGLTDEGLAKRLLTAGHEVELRTLEEALDPKGAPPDLALVHQSAPTVGLVRGLCLGAPTTAWVFILDHFDATLAASLLEVGAADVVLSPRSPEELELTLLRVARDARLKARLGYFEHQATKDASIEHVITSSPKMREILERILRVSRRSALGPPLPVLLTGETGTGKGLLARVIHFASRRRDGPFVEVNCAAIPSTLIEAELFGHERGAFTDAKSARAGLLETADGGTLFLDEISYLPQDGQAKLLTVLESKRVRRLGGRTERTVDVQIIAATSHDLLRKAQEGQFRSELLHRLHGLALDLPSLRERGEDAVLLAEHFLTRVCGSYGLSPKRLSDEARGAVGTYAWPGNVRELFHAVQRAVLTEDGDVVKPKDLALASGGTAVGTGVSLDPGVLRLELPAEGLSLDGVERALILRALDAEKGNVTKAAQLLQVTRDTLRSRMEKHGLSAKEPGR